MKVNHVLLSLSLLFFAACQKKENTTIVTKTSVQPDSVKQVLQPSFIPATDTFYEKSNVYNYPAIYVYVYHPSADTIRLTSNYLYLNSFMGFNVDLVINKTNYYSWVASYDALTNYTFRFVRDSFYYNGSFDDPGDDTYLVSFAGKKISGNGR